jgi:hypothetical protein
VVFSNRGSQRVNGMTGVLTGGVRGDEDRMAGNFAGAIVAVGQRIEVGPGASIEPPLMVGTASCLPDLSYRGRRRGRVTKPLSSNGIRRSAIVRCAMRAEN